MISCFQYIEGTGVNIVLMRLPCKACVSPNDDDTYTMFLDDRLSDDELTKECEHELKHICNNDFASIIPASEIEYYTHD